MATVTSCTYNAGAGRAMAFGLPTKKHFQIAYNYWAKGELHTGELASATAIPQGTLFPVNFNPEALHEHNHEQSIVSARAPWLTVAIAGSVILSLAYASFLYGCHTR